MGEKKLRNRSRRYYKMLSIDVEDIRKLLNIRSFERGT